MRIVFMGTPDFAVPALEALHEAGHEIIAVYTQPPRPAGRRGLALTPSPVHKTADALGIPVSRPLILKSKRILTHLKPTKRYCCGGCLWIVVTAKHFRCAPLWVLEYSRLAFAKMARCSAYPPRHYVR